MQTRAMKRLAAATLSFSLLAASCGEDDETTVAGDEPTEEMPSEEMPSEETLPETTGDPDAHDHAETVDANPDAVPTIDVSVTADPAGGVNITLATTNFTSAPESASSDHVDGEGHFHLSIDGERQLRFYNESIYYAGVVEGDVEIGVALVSNDHRAYTVDGEAIEETQAFTVPEHGHTEHSHDAPEAVEVVGDAPVITLAVEADAKSGWNAFVSVDGFTLSAENVSREHVAGEGHLHIDINGQKLGRLYGEATHIAALPVGPVEVAVVAYTNDHQPYTVDGEPVSAAVQLEVAS